MAKHSASARGPSGGRRNPRFTRPIGKKRRTSKKKGYVLVTKRQVKKWNKGAKDASTDLGNFIKCFRAVANFTCGANASSFASLEAYGVAALHADTSALEYFDPTTSPPTLVTTNTSSLTQQSKIQVEVSTIATWANNYGVPLWIDCYCMVPKVDTDIHPGTIFASGLVDQGSPSSTSVFVYPSWSKALTTLYEFKSHKKVCLAPGESVSLNYSRTFQFDPSYTDTHNLDFQEKLGSHFYCARLEGCVGHSKTTPANVGSGISEVDYNMRRYTKVRYAAGIKTTRYKVTDNGAAQTDGTVLGWPGDASNTVFNTGLPA